MPAPSDVAEILAAIDAFGRCLAAQDLEGSVAL
jgi:hypothetical protein